MWTWTDVSKILYTFSPNGGISARKDIFKDKGEKLLKRNTIYWKETIYISSKNKKLLYLTKNIILFNVFITWVEYSYFCLSREPSKFKRVGPSKTLRLLFNMWNHVTTLNSPTVLLTEAQMGEIPPDGKGLLWQWFQESFYNTMAIQYIKSKKLIDVTM